MGMRARPLHVASLLLAAAIPAQTVVFQSDFNGAMPPEVVRGHAGYGPVSSEFGLIFLGAETADEVLAQVTGLPAHDSVSLDSEFTTIGKAGSAQTCGTGCGPELVGTAVPLTLSNTAATGTIPVPNTSGLAGLHCYLQTWTVAPGTNQLGALFSNGLKIEIGG